MSWISFNVPRQIATSSVTVSFLITYFVTAKESTQHRPDGTSNISVTFCQQPGATVVSSLRHTTPRRPRRHLVVKALSLMSRYRRSREAPQLSAVSQQCVVLAVCSGLQQGTEWPQFSPKLFPAEMGEVLPATYRAVCSVLTKSWLRHCATSGRSRVRFPILIGIFLWHNPSGRTVALGLTQPLTEMSTRNISWG